MGGTEKPSPTFFKKSTDFRKWLAKNHTAKKELLVGYYKVDSGIPSMNWSESVDEALCYGWIDGVRKSIDTKSYTIRFTPRKPTSIWSAINIKKMEDLIQKGLMQDAGLASFELRKEHRSKIYSHENEAKKFPPVFEKKLKANKPAWDYFTKQAPSYQKVVVHWILSAKQEKTQWSRFEKLVQASELQKRLA